VIPLFVELCAGTAALSLRLHGGPRARPPVSRMGNKQGYAAAILRTLGLRSGSGAARYLWCEPDPGCRLLLTSYTDPELRAAAAEIIRGWADEDPRALWERLRAEGPVREGEPREVARVVIMSGWSVTGSNLSSAYFRGPHGVSNGVHERSALTIAGASKRLNEAPPVPATILPDARAVDPREVARWMLSVGWTMGSGGRCVAPGACPDGVNPAVSIPGMTARLTSLPTLPATILPDAREVQPATLPPGTVAYMDPPYANTTGYGHDLGRAEVCALAERWASAGAWVVISEAEPLTELGWPSVEITGERVGQKRTFSRQQREFLTMSKPPRWRPSVQSSLFGGEE